jgi:hypothetical protein
LQNGGASCLYSALEEEVPQLSNAGIHDLCKEVPFMIDVQVPDACSSNRRKKAKTADESPANCFCVFADCAAHQCFRCVQHKEAEVVGDVYAIAVTCSHVGYRNGLQLGLQKVLQKVVRVLGAAGSFSSCCRKCFSSRSLMAQVWSISHLQHDASYQCVSQLSLHVCFIEGFGHGVSLLRCRCL